jgi:hypothetical protein
MGNKMIVPTSIVMMMTRTCKRRCVQCGYCEKSNLEAQSCFAIEIGSLKPNQILPMEISADLDILMSGDLCI